MVLMAADLYRRLHSAIAARGAFTFLKNSDLLPVSSLAREIFTLAQVGDEIEEVYVTATAFDPEAKEADDYDTANTHLKFKVLHMMMRNIKLLKCR